MTPEQEQEIKDIIIERKKNETELQEIQTLLSNKIAKMWELGNLSGRNGYSSDVRAKFEYALNKSLDLEFLEIIKNKNEVLTNFKILNNEENSNLVNDYQRFQAYEKLKKKRNW
jgi:hypothetical protein